MVRVRHGAEMHVHAMSTVGSDYDGGSDFLAVSATDITSPYVYYYCNTVYFYVIAHVYDVIKLSATNGD